MTDVRSTPRKAATEAGTRGPAQADAGWSVWRQDDNGSRFEMSAGHTREEAERLAAEFEARGHKQTYSVKRS